MHLCKTVQYLVQWKRWQLWFLSPYKLILPELYISWLVTINKQLFQPTKPHCCVQLHIRLTDTLLPMVPLYLFFGGWPTLPQWLQWKEIHTSKGGTMVESSWLLETKSPQMMLLDLVVEQSFSGGKSTPTKPAAFGDPPAKLSNTKELSDSFTCGVIITIVPSASMNRKQSFNISFQWPSLSFGLFSTSAPK